MVYAAGVDEGPDGDLVTAGGRVLDVVGLGHDLAAARRAGYRAAGTVSWPGVLMRTDIAELAGSTP
jgi:phosphoribosylamine---glycine ligase